MHLISVFAVVTEQLSAVYDSDTGLVVEYTTVTGLSVDTSPKLEPVITTVSPPAVVMLPDTVDSELKTGTAYDVFVEVLPFALV